MDASESKDSCSLHQAPRNGKDTSEDSKIPSAARPAIKDAAATASGLPLESSHVVDVNEASKEKKDAQVSSTIMLNLAEGGIENDGEGKGIPDAELTASDVLTSGRHGGSYMSHAGNKKFKTYVHSHITEFSLARIYNKDTVARKVVDNVKAQGGRFLKLDKDTKLWHKMGDKEAIKKTKDALYNEARRLKTKKDLERNLREQPGVPDKDLRDSDVLCVKASAARPGNKKYVALIQENVTEYKSANYGQKKDVAERVVNEILASDGRFLEKDGATGVWHLLDMERALKKVIHALCSASAHASKKAEKETRLREAKSIPEEELDDADVLTSGKKGDKCMSHAGNRKFRTFVHSHAAEYALAAKESKVVVARKLVDNVKAEGGRFLKKDEGTNVWRKMSDKEAIAKTRDALYRAASAIKNKQDSERNRRERPSGKASPVKKRKHGGTIPQTPNNNTANVTCPSVDDEPKCGSKWKAAADLNSSQQRPVVESGVVFSKKRVGRSDTVARDNSSLGDVDDTDTVSGNERRDQENGQACQNISHSEDGDGDTEMNRAFMVYPDGVVSSSRDVADNENEFCYEGNDQACRDTSHSGNGDDKEMNDAPLVYPDGVVSSCEDVATGTADHELQEQYPFLQIFFAAEDA